MKIKLNDVEKELTKEQAEELIRDIAKQISEQKYEPKNGDCGFNQSMFLSIAILNGKDDMLYAAEERLHKDCNNHCILEITDFAFNAFDLLKAIEEADESLAKEFVVGWTDFGCKRSKAELYAIGIACLAKSMRMEK